MIPEFFHDVVQILSTSSNILTVKKNIKSSKAKTNLSPLDLTTSTTSTMSTIFWYDQILDRISQNRCLVKSRVCPSLYYENC